MNKYKIVKSDLIKKQEKLMPPEVKKEFDKALEELAKDPYAVGTLCTPSDFFTINCEMTEQIFGIEPEEVLSMVVSNPEFFKDIKKTFLYF